jgi:uncharacterized protein YrzB (UPF0473 family)
MLENLSELSGAQLRSAIAKRIKVYTNAENMLDSFIDAVGKIVTASSDEETYDGLEETLAAHAASLEATAAGRNDIDVTGEVGKRANIITDHTVELPKFSAPPRETLVKNHSYLKKARQYQDELDYLVTRLKDSTDKDDKALLKTLIGHRKLMNEKKGKAQDILEDLAERHVPRELAHASESLEEHVIKLLNSDGKEVGAQWFITQDGDNLDFTFVLHTPIQDHSKHSIDVYLVLTGRVQESAKGFLMRVYLTSMNQFKLPGHYELGERISFTSKQTMANSIKREANKLMAKQGLISALSTNKLDVTTRQLRNAGIAKLKHVIDIRVQGNAVYLLLANVSDRDIERDTVADLIVLLKNVLHKQKTGAVFMRSIEETKSGKKMMKLISVNEV